MRLVPPLLLLAALAACDTPGPGYSGVAPVRMHLGGSSFDIRVTGRRAEAIRVNAEWAPRLAAVGPQAVLAIERVSGCKVNRLTGDAARMVARLDCGAGPPPPPPSSGELFCDLDLHEDGETGSLYCVPSDQTFPQPG